MTTETPTIDEVLADPSISTWLKTSLRTALDRDLVDAACDVELLAQLLNRRADSLVLKLLAKCKDLPATQIQVDELHRSEIDTVATISGKQLRELTGDQKPLNNYSKVLVENNQPWKPGSPSPVKSIEETKPFIEVQTADAEHAFRAARGFLMAYPELSVSIVRGNGDPPEYLMRDAQSFPIQRAIT